MGLDLWGDSRIPVGKLADPISKKQAEVLKELIEKSETEMDFFLDWCECASIEELPYERFNSARGLLEEKIRRMSREKKNEDS